MNSTDDPEPPLEEQTRRPLDTALRQQRVKAWYPVLDPWWVIGAFVLFGAIFVPVGKLLRDWSLTRACVECTQDDGMVFLIDCLPTLL